MGGRVARVACARDTVLLRKSDQTQGFTGDWGTDLTWESPLWTTL